MANYNTLKNAIQTVIKTNGNNEITGALLQQSLLAMINSLGGAYLFAGVAYPTFYPGTPDQNVFYIAGQAGTYTHFNGITVANGELAILTYNGSWTKLVSGGTTSERVDEIYSTKLVADKYTFGGVSNLITFNPITLSQPGDMLEFRAKCGQSSFNILASFCHNGNNIAIGLHSAQVGVKNASNSWLSGMNSSVGEFNFNTAGAGVISSNFKTFQLKWTETGFELWIEGTKYHEITGVPTVTFDRIGGTYNNNHWIGELEFFRVTKDGNTVDLLDFPGYYASGDVTVTTHQEVTGLLSQKVDKIPGKGLSTNDFTNYDKEIAGAVAALGWGILLNGTSTQIVPNNNIVLSQNGDSIEFDLIVNETGALINGGYAFAQNQSGIGIGISQNRIYLRSDDGTWLIQSVELVDAVDQNVKIVYADDKITIYRNGVSIGVYNGQKTVTLVNFGHHSTYGYWDGTILAMKVNNQDYDIFANTVITDGALYRKNGFLTDEQAARVQTPIIIRKVDATNFNVFVLNRKTGKYLVHTFTRWQGQRTIDGTTYTTQDIWTANWVNDINGNHLYQGNLNFIYKVGKVNGVSASDASVNENYHVGPSHGCIVMQFAKFFADGKAFDPASITDDIKCSTFRFIVKSNCYVVDSSYDTGNVNNYPKIEDGQPIINAVNYIDASYTADNRIKWFNRLIQVRNAAIQYAQMNGGMVQGQMAYVNTILLNDAAISCNTVTIEDGAVVYAEPTGYDSQIIKGKYIASNIVTMWGDEIILHQTMMNADNSKQNHANVYTWSNDGISAKCYMSPILLTNNANPDTINAGDEISVYLEREIESN